MTTVLGKSPHSNVTESTKNIANRGTSAAAGLVSRCLGSHPGASNAAVGEWVLSRSRKRSHRATVSERVCCKAVAGAFS